MTGVQDIKRVLWCRASQIDNPGERNCSGCPYETEDGCDDLRIMNDALDTINRLDIFNKTVSGILDKGYSIRFSKNEEDELPEIVDGETEEITVNPDDMVDWPEWLPMTHKLNKPVKVKYRGDKGDDDA